MFGPALDIERPFEQHGDMVRTRVRRRRIVAALVLAAVVGVLTGPVADAVGVGGGGSGDGRTYVVRPGDTLWAVARRAAPSVDPRVVVDAIASANDVDPGALVPGQQLSIPSFG